MIKSCVYVYVYDVGGCYRSTKFSIVFAISITAD